MKKLITVIMVSLCMAATMHAQKRDVQSIANDEAAIKALYEIIANNDYDNRYKEDFINELCKNKRLRNNPKLYTTVASAFWYKAGMDTASAYKYCDMALNINPAFLDVYTLKAEIQTHLGNDDQAVALYRQGIDLNRTDKEAWRRFASYYIQKHDTAAVEQLLLEAKQAIPDYPANLELCRVYRQIDEYSAWNKALLYYDVAETEEMDAVDYQQWCALYNSLAQANRDIGNKSAELTSFISMFEKAEQGMARFPDHGGLMRAALLSASRCADMYPATDMDKKREYAQKGMEIGKKFLASGDTLVNDDTHYNYAICLMNYGKNEDALAEFGYLKDNGSENMQNVAIQYITNIYRDAGEWTKAADEYALYMKRLEDAGKAKRGNYTNYAQIYIGMAEELNGQDKLDAYLKAIDVYRQAAKKQINDAPYMYYRICTLFNTLSSKEELIADLSTAQTDAKALHSLLSSKSNLTDDEKEYLQWACYIIGEYHFRTVEKQPYKVTKNYFLQMYKLNPDSSLGNYAKRVLTSQVFKMKL